MRSAYHFSEKVLKVELWDLHKVPSVDLLNLLYCCIDSAELSLVRSGHYVQTVSAGLGGDRASPYVPTGATPQPPMIYQSWVIITAVRRTEGRRGNAPVPPHRPRRISQNL